jgi:hypothetical protein
VDFDTPGGGGHKSDLVLSFHNKQHVPNQTDRVSLGFEGGGGVSRSCWGDPGNWNVTTGPPVSVCVFTGLNTLTLRQHMMTHTTRRRNQYITWSHPFQVFLNGILGEGGFFPPTVLVLSPEVIKKHLVTSLVSSRTFGTHGNAGPGLSLLSWRGGFESDPHLVVFSAKKKRLSATSNNYLFVPRGGSGQVAPFFQFFHFRLKKLKKNAR